MASLFATSGLPAFHGLASSFARTAPLILAATSRQTSAASIRGVLNTRYSSSATSAVPSTSNLLRSINALSPVFASGSVGCSGTLARAESILRPGYRKSSTPSATFKSASSLRHYSSSPKTSLTHGAPLRPTTTRMDKSILNLVRSLSGLGIGSGPSHSTMVRAEQLANGSPTNAYAQERFYDLLLRANMPKAVAERYRSGLYASNKGCEEKYSVALERLSELEDGASSIMSQDTTKAIGQAAAARSRGGNVAVTSGKMEGKANTGDKESPIYVVVDETIGSSIFKWIKFFFYFGLFGYIALVVLTLAADATGTLKKIGGPNNNEATASQQTVRFTDVHGCEEAKEELTELVEFLKNPEQFSTLGGKLPKGVLLVGPPGTGKTLLARAVAGEAGVPFFFMSGSEFDEVYVGVGAKRVRELFAQARAKAPAIVFIDELDAIGGKRNGRDAAYVKQTLNQLLVDLDGFSQNSGVIFLAATNFPEMLDKALTRPGRFDRNVNVPLPDVRGRMAILRHHMKKIKASPEIDPSVIARGTPGFSGAAIENMVNQAAVRASRLKRPSVVMDDFDWAKDKIMMGAERRSAVIPPKERLMTAYHEGGHTLVGLYTAGHSPIHKVTIMPRGNALGITHYLPEGDQLSITKKQMKASIDSALGGKIAEEMIYGDENVSGGCSSDLQAATGYARHMVMRLGMSAKLGDVDFTQDFEHLSSGTKEMIEREVRRLIEEGRERATKILSDKKSELHLLAAALVEYETLNLEEVKKVIKGEKLPYKLAELELDKKGKKPELKIPEGIYSGPPLEGGPSSTGEVQPRA